MKVKMLLWHIKLKINWTMNLSKCFVCDWNVFWDMAYCDFELYLMRCSLCSNQVSSQWQMKHEPLTTDDLNACYDLKDSLKIPALNKAQWCQVQDSSPFCSAFFECLVQLLLTSQSVWVSFLQWLLAKTIWSKCLAGQVVQEKSLLHYSWVWMI